MRIRTPHLARLIPSSPPPRKLGRDLFVRRYKSPMPGGGTLAPPPPAIYDVVHINYVEKFRFFAKGRPCIEGLMSEGKGVSLKARTSQTPGRSLQ